MQICKTFESAKFTCAMIKRAVLWDEADSDSEDQLNEKQKQQLERPEGLEEDWHVYTNRNITFFEALCIFRLRKQLLAQHRFHFAKTTFQCQEVASWCKKRQRYIPSEVVLENILRID